MLYWDGTNFGNLFPSPEDVNRKARIITEYKNSLMLIRTIENGTENHQRIWASFPGNPTLFYDYDKLDLPDEVIIKNALPLGEYLIIYTDAGIYIVYWTEGMGWLNDAIDKEINIIAPKTLSSDGNFHFFLSSKGLYILEGRSLVPISTKKFNKLLFEKIDPAGIKNAFGYVYSDLHKYFLAYPALGSNYCNRVAIIDTDTMELIGDMQLPPYTSWLGNFPKVFLEGTNDPRLAEGITSIPIAGSDGYVYEFANLYHADGLYYQSLLELKKEDFGMQFDHKRILKIFLSVKKYNNNNIVLKVKIINEKNEFKETLIEANGEIDTEQIYTGYIDFVGKQFRVLVSDVDNLSKFDIRYIGIEFYPITEL